MAVSTRKQIRDHCLAVTKQDNTQIGSLVNDFINNTLQEINNPGWALKGHNHLWSWLRRKTTFSASAADNVLERDVYRVAILRQLTTPARLIQLTEADFLKMVPNPSATGSPLFYRTWEIEGVSTRLASADKVDVVSSSSSDGSSFTATVMGYVSGRLHAESYTLNGTTVINGTNTFDARELIVSKSGFTTGNITFRKNADSSTLVVLGPQEITARFKVITLYPAPSSAITMYLEYYKRIKELVNDSDVPEFDPQFHYIVGMGTIAKVFKYLGKTTDWLSMQSIYKEAIMGMVAADKTEPDLIEVMERRASTPLLQVRRSDTNPA